MFTQPENRLFNSITIFTVTCSVISQFAGCTINPACIATPVWCDSSFRLTETGPTCLWQSQYGLRIPYQVSVPSLSWAYNSWVNVWGFSSPAGSYNLDLEIEQAGPAASRCLNFRNGDSKYDISACSKTGFIYIPYGQVAINTLRQQYRVGAPWIITFIPLVTRGNGHVRELPAREEAGIQPRYIEQIGNIEPGTLTTYDWVNDTVLAPTITVPRLTEALWINISRAPGVIASPYTGIYREGRQHNVNRSMGADLMRLQFPGFNVEKKDRTMVAEFGG